MATATLDERERPTRPPRNPIVYFLALAADYDGTVAHHGIVDQATRDALAAFRKTGRRLILVTGRELSSLREVFESMELFDRIVVENGALLYNPATKTERSLAPPPPTGFIDYLRRRNVTPLSVGRTIVATWEPNEKIVLEAIHVLGLELQIIFNKGAVMILPPGVNKATGLAAAVKEMQLSPINVVGVGDAENDHAFLAACGCGASVANALPVVKASVDVHLEGSQGAGVVELMQRICREDAKLLPPDRHGLRVGTDSDGSPVLIEPHRGSTLIAGTSGAGKSTIAVALTERMVEKGLEFCVVDPEGDYDSLENAVCVGDANTAPSVHEVMDLLQKRVANVVVNTQALSVHERPDFFANLLPRLLSLRTKTGRPHWLLIDEAHHLVSAYRHDTGSLVPENLDDVVFITVHPETVTVEALRTTGYVVALGDQANGVVETFCRTIGESCPRLPEDRLKDREVLFWQRGNGKAPVHVTVERSTQKRRRHIRKYAEGDLGKELSFYFRGRDDRLNLRAQNLSMFVQIAEGIDDATWEHHRRGREYSKWFRDVIKDDDLARETSVIEEDSSLDGDESRRRVVDAVQRRYTAPARE